MAYIKNNWVDQSVERPKTYEMTNNSDGSVTLIDSFGLVSELGTPVNADNMNHIEEGIEACDLRKYNTSETYNIGEWVTGIVDKEKGIYSSLVDGNLGNQLTDATKWKKVEFGGDSTKSLPLFSTILQDHVLSFEESKGWALQGTYVYKDSTQERYGYPDFYAKCIEEKNTGEATETTLGESTITTYNNPNGHIYYNISDKLAVDAFFNTYGACWMYGIDEENERIFLPRNDWFEQCTSTNPGEFIEAGLPNITGSFGIPKSERNVSPTGAFTQSSRGYNNTAGEIANTNGWITEFNASNADPIYGNSDTVQPNSVKKLLYICVGNTEVTTSITNVTEITTSDNDTIPLGYSTYQGGNVQPSVAWLKSEGQWNSGALYTTFYNHYVPLIGQAFAAGYVREHTDDYDDYDLVINQEDMTFRLPLLDGSEDQIDWNERIKVADNWEQGQNYVAPQNGTFKLTTTATAVGQYVNIYINSILTENRLSTANGENSILIFDAAKGDIVNFETNYGGTKGSLYFTPAKGNGDLYFKVGNAVQNLELIDAGAITNVLADKIGRQECKAYITETYVNDTSGYRIWSDGYCEQWGIYSSLDSGKSAGAMVNLLKPYSSTNYILTANVVMATTTTFSNSAIKGAGLLNKTPSSFHCATSYAGSTTAWGNYPFEWKTEGYLAEGEY